MVDLAGEGRTVLLSSHQIGEVERVASHVALLHQGRLVLAEPLDELRARTFAAGPDVRGRDHPLAPPDALPIELIDADDGACQARWLVHATAEAVSALGTWPGVAAMEIKTPTLEEIYIGYMRGRRPEAAGSLVA